MHREKTTVFIRFFLNLYLCITEVHNHCSCLRVSANNLCLTYCFYVFTIAHSICSVIYGRKKKEILFVAFISSTIRSVCVNIHKNSSKKKRLHLFDLTKKENLFRRFDAFRNSQTFWL